jgi:outer membrane protein assembly factor BamB
MRSLLTGVLLLLFPAITLAEDHSPGFLAGQRAGAKLATLPTIWDRSTNVAWKTEIPGSGWSSPIVWGDRVFVTSAISDGKTFEPRKGLYIQDLQGKPLPGEHDWQVHCLDARSGKVLWSRSAFKGKMLETIHIKNSLASETPVTDGKHVWAYFGNVGVACFDFTGKLIWKEKTSAHRTRMGWGPAASPALVQGKLLLVHDNEEKSFLLALDAKTGKLLWRVERKEGSNWATPFVWKNSLRTEIVTAGSGRVRSYDLDGKLLWDFAGMSIISIPTPFASGDLLYVSSGYVADVFRKPVYAIRPGGRGDISLKGGKSTNESIVWYQAQAGSYHPTPIVAGEHLYVLYDRGFLACYEAKTGKEVYGKKRIAGGASAFTASPWAYDDKIFCLSEDGETFVIQAGKEFKVLGRNALDEMCLATPAVAGGSLFVRTQTKVYSLRK